MSQRPFPQPGDPRKPGQPPNPGQPPQATPPQATPAPGHPRPGQPGPVQPGRPMQAGQQNPYGQNAYQQTPYGGQGGHGGPPQNSNAGKTILIVLGIVGGVIVLSVAICGTIGFLAVKNVQDGLGEMVAELKEQAEKVQQARAEHFVSEYRDNEIIQEKIGNITSTRSKQVFSEGVVVIARVELTGDKGSGTLQIEQDWNISEMEGEQTPMEDTAEDASGATIKAVLIVDGERFVIDEDASNEQNSFQFEYDFDPDSDSEDEDFAE